MNRLYALCFAFGAALYSHAQAVLLEENFTAGIPATWTVADGAPDLIPHESVSEFTAPWIGTIIDDDTVAASTSYYDPEGEPQDYLITPELALGNFSKIVWDARSVDASFPDGYEVLISTTDNAIESFTDTLMSVPAEFPYWTKRSVQLDEKGYANQSVYVAFKNSTTNGFILLLDNFVLLGAEVAGLTAEKAVTMAIGPNPTQDILNIYSETQIVKTTIYSLDGRALLTASATSISLADLSKGTYIATVETVAGTRRFQVVKK